MLPIYEYNGSLAGNLLENTDVINALTSSETTKPLSAAQGKVLNNKIINVETQKVVVDGAEFYLSKNNNIVNLTIYCTRSLTKDTILSFAGVIPSGWNPTKRIYTSYSAVGGSVIHGSGRYAINPDNQDINLICDNDGMLEHMASISWIIGGVFE